jgi:hypothetical protein
MKYELVDGSTGFHFGIGTLAGVFGMDPKMVLLAALLADATWEVIQARHVGVAFEAEHGQSKAKEIVNLLSIIAGAHIGQAARELYKPEPAAAPAPPAPAPTPVTPNVSGFGLLPPVGCRW